MYRNQKVKHLLGIKLELNVWSGLFFGYYEGGQHEQIITYLTLVAQRFYSDHFVHWKEKRGEGSGIWTGRGMQRYV